MSDYRRTALVRITPDTIANMLDLPEGVHVVGVTADFPTTSLVVMLQSDRFPEVDSNAEPPIIGSSMTTKIITPASGSSESPKDGPFVKPYFRIEVTLPEDTDGNA